MSTRLNMFKTQPEAYKAMLGLEKYTSSIGINPLQKELIKIRASQINGCAYCINMHTKDARKLGETETRIYLISAWREAPNVFNEEDRVLLELTESVTLIHQHGISDELYEKAITLFGEEKTAQIIMAIITINGWNRIAVSLHMHPEL
ncbi:MAG: carboxymuconolactone decarboxylase family protein [Chitinophagaceae bacterium]